MISDVTPERLSAMCQGSRARFVEYAGNAVCENCGSWNECNCTPIIEPQAQMILDRFHVMAVILSASSDEATRVVGEQMHETVFGILDGIETLA